MAPAKTVLSISQDAFDELVRENMDDLGMDPAEALEDAIQTLTLQGVDLSGAHFFPPLLPSDGSFFLSRNILFTSTDFCFRSLFLV